MKASTQKKIGNVIGKALMCLVILIVLFPVLWALPSMFKGRSEIFELPLHWLPNEWITDNFKTVFNMPDYNYLLSIGSTTLVSVLSVVLSLLVNMMAAYAFARVDFPFKKFLWIYMFSTMFIPGITILLTSVRVVSFLNMLDTIWVLIIPGIASGYNIFFFRQYFYGVPKYIEEAAMIDGLSKGGIFFRIYTRISTAPMVIIGMSVFMGYYNSFLWPVMTITKKTELYQIMQLVRTLSSRYKGNYGVVLVATLISLIIPFSIYCFFQKYIVQGISIAGIK
ncbi:MAG: carbohydrate ABC transporter permease [Clostridia bacterium]|nr:carbohydrate ABC transporter permease [Clostridia bacterium]